MANKPVTLEELKKLIPSKKNVLTQEIVDIINQTQSEPEFQGESLVQTMVTYQNVIKNAKVSIKEYINAIRFCAYLVSMNDNYTEAYKRTFSNRKFVKDRLDAKPGTGPYSELTSAASRYRRSKLVTDILTASQVPLGMLFLGHQYEAVNVLYNVMHTAKYDRDKINAAKELLAAVKLPETAKLELDVNVKENSAIQQLNDQLAQLASRQIQHLEAGDVDLDDIGAMKVINENDITDAEIEENE